jgi:hypothetical protein
MASCGPFCTAVAAPEATVMPVGLAGAWQGQSPKPKVQSRKMPQAMRPRTLDIELKILVSVIWLKSRQRAPDGTLQVGDNLKWMFI